MCIMNVYFLIFLSPLLDKVISFISLCMIEFGNVSLKHGSLVVGRSLSLEVHWDCVGVIAI